MYVFIINPNAGNGRAIHIFEKLQKSALFQQLESRYYYTEYEGHAEEITASCATEKGITRLVVIGGDGTIHEVMNGLGESSMLIGFIPGGSGNDFARGVEIKGKPEAILKEIIDGENRIDYWLGNYIHDDNQERHFVNSMGFGFDAQTAHTANHSFYKRIFNNLQIGTASYIIAILQVLTKFKPMKIEISIDGEKRIIDNCLLISIGNHPYYGGGMKIMPNANVQPEKFSVLIVHSVPKWKVLALFMTVFTGKHDKISGVELLEAKSLRINSAEPIYTQVDGQTSTCYTSEITKQKKSVQILSTGK